MNKPIVLITGATSGIGLATARVFAENRYPVIITGRRSERLSGLREELTDAGAESVLTLCFDIRSREACEQAVASLPDDWMDVSILINNAGLARGFDPVQSGSMDDWDEMIDTNVKGMLYMTRLISPGMVARNKGHIINIGSSAGKQVYPKGNVYCATKFAVEGFTRSIRLDLHAHGIRVSQVSPGHVEETEFARVRFHWDTEKAKIYEDFNPLTSADVADTVFFIANRPPHVNIQDVFLMGSQQASNMLIDRSGRKYD